MADPRLSVLAGPPLPPIHLDGEGPFTLGRSSKSDIRLEDPAVSRRHAELANSLDGWTITDTGSRHGVSINGVAIDPEIPALISSGDRLQIGPWTLRFRLGDIEPSTLASINDTTRRGATRIPRDQLGALAQKRLALLIDSARSIHTAVEESAVAHAVVDALVAGAGFERAALIRPVAGFDSLDVLAMRTGESRTPITPSRTLLEAASEGALVKLEDDSAMRGAMSIVSSGVTEALCAPIFVGDTIDAYAYVDSTQTSQPQPDAAAFAAAIADLCGLAFANLRRHSLEVQQDRLLRDLRAARDVQKRLMPNAAGRIGPLEYTMHFQPGRVVAGDFFGLRLINDHAAAMFIGDVAGKGLGASLMMATIQSHLDALLRTNQPLPNIVSELNRYIVGRSASNEFATLWIGVVDMKQGSLHAVDAGHGYAMVRRATGAEMPSFEGGPPIGVEASIEYSESVLEIAAGDRVVLFSDGVPEQPDRTGEHFGVQRIIDALSASKAIETDITALIDELTAHAPSDEFGDDVTIASLLIS